MARLPRPGGDDGQWAKVLNDFLLVAHNPDGTPRPEAARALTTATVGLRDLRTVNPPGQPIRNLLLSNTGTDLVWKQTIEVNVRDYGALGDGVHDDTEAIQAAINDTTDGGAVVFPRGVFMIRGIKINNKGTSLVGDGRWATRIVRLSGTDPLIDISGSGTGIGHARYDNINSLMIDGAGLPGPLLRSYYADTCVYREVSFIHCRGTAVDLVEVWDTRFDECTWEDCGSVEAPATLLRNSTPPGTFGFSADNTNQIYFTGCRWEDFRNGAICLDGAAGGSTQKLNGIFFVSCKMETRLAAGSAIQLLDNTTVIFVNQLYLAIMAADPSYTAPIDVIEDHASHLFMTNVYVQWGAATGLPNSVAHIVSEAPHMYHELGAFYPGGDPAQATIWVEPAASDVTVSSLWVNRGRPGIGNFSKLLDSNPLAGLNLPLRDPGVFRVTDHDSGRDLVKIDNNPNRPALHTLNGVDTVGFSDAYITEKWRVIGASGAARFAAGKFQIEATKGYVGVNTPAFAGIAALVKLAADSDRGLAIMRSSPAATGRLMEFQDETHNIQGLAIDSNGRPVAVGTPPRVTPGTQVSYASPGLQVRDIAGNISAAVKPSPTAPGTIATVTFSRPYAAAPLNIAINDHSAIPGDLYVSARDASSFTVSTRSALRGGSILNFDYSVIA
ncbi:MAG TPA: glycosyl hydrolase family 28-related protein [Candidatus Saccharimonadia bacterium]|nr:glycosyl hydrolase family 28-related protein [Candidatus Saccharimonadia bacterium]